MKGSLPVDELAERLRLIARSGAPGLEEAVEGYLARETAQLAPQEKLAVLERLSRRLEGGGAEESVTIAAGDAAKMVALLLGTGITGVSSAELAERFSDSLNTVFDALNRILAVIQSTLLGRVAELETIRQVISAHIEEEHDEASLKAYLERIEEAFLISHRAFQEAARKVVADILAGLDPELLESSVKGGINIGPLRKAEAYELYQERFRQVRSSLESGIFREQLLREFEKACEKGFAGV